MGMGVAAELTAGDVAAEREHLGGLRGPICRALSWPPARGARVNGAKSNRLPNTLNIAFEYLEGESILVLLDEFGICASTGSACTAGSVEPSHVLRAMKVPPQWLQGAVRFSLSRYNTGDEIRFAAGEDSRHHRAPAGAVRIGPGGNQRNSSRGTPRSGL